MRQKTGLFSALLLLIFVVAACSGPGSAVPQGINEGTRARDFTLRTMDGSKASLSDYRGNVVLINFWATWCAPCRAEIPDFEAAYQSRLTSVPLKAGVRYYIEVTSRDEAAGGLSLSMLRETESTLIFLPVIRLD